MNLHLCFEGNFVENSLRVFEKFHPKCNICLVINKGQNLHIGDIVPTKLVNSISEDELRDVLSFCSSYKVENVVLHGLSKRQGKILKYLKKHQAYSGRVYWIFWGFELYNALGEMGKYKLIDNINLFSPLTYCVPTPISNIIRKLSGKQRFSVVLPDLLPYIDFFCFWLRSDYDLLKENFRTDVQFKFFQYSASNRDDICDVKIEPYPKLQNVIMVNHQASMTGNHITILNKLKKLSGIESYKIITPLAYGSKYVKKNTLRVGNVFFPGRFEPKTEMQPIKQYVSFLSTVPVAIIGALRQEASGNIIRLLSLGSKVFLRRRNPLLSYYRNIGYIIFSFEDDLNTIDDLSPLGADEQIHNMQIARNRRINYEDFMPTFFD